MSSDLLVYAASDVNFVPYCFRSIAAVETIVVVHVLT